ncbi:MAG: HlyD family efflux transporter periplasmic adaptor subunit [Clostridia bacterium]|nr:HlyD family efflux transporter periplasmic adaptor subunit [Clostridia bacterium]
MVSKKTNKNKINSKKRINKRAIVICIAIFLLFICMLYSFIAYVSNPVNKVTVIQGEISKEQSVSGYIIRDEKIISTNMVSDIALTIADDSRAGKNDIVATYISKSQEELEGKISDLDIKIQEAMEDQTNIYSTDTKKIEIEVDNLLSKVDLENNRQTILQYKEQINNLIEKKAKMIGELSSSGSYINQLIKERNSYEKDLNESIDYIKTDRSGLISTRIDNLESVLNIDSLADITYSQLEEYNLRSDEIIACSSKSLKVIDNYYCYIITEVNSIEDKYEVGDTISIRLNYGNTEKTKAEIFDIKDSDNGKKMLIFKITKNVEGLVDYRKISFDIIWSETVGYKIPNAALSGSGNNATVVLIKYGLEYIVRVKILEQNEDYAIITDLSTADIEELNLSSDDVKRKINIYDELIIK